MQIIISSVLALELRQNKVRYERTAKEMTLKYASSDRQELKQVYNIICQALVLKSFRELLFHCQFGALGGGNLTCFSVYCYSYVHCIEINLEGQREGQYWLGNYCVSEVHIVWYFTIRDFFGFQTVIDVDSEVPNAYLCPLTKKLFTDPVITPYGHTYEREALMEYMRQNGPKDPIAQQSLDPSRLTPNTALKSIIQNFKQVSKELS